MEHHTPISTRLSAPDISADSTNDHFSTPLTKLGSNSLANIDFGHKSTPRNTENYANLSASGHAVAGSRITTNASLLLIPNEGLLRGPLAPLSDNSHWANQVKTDLVQSDRSLRYQAFTNPVSASLVSEQPIGSDKQLPASFFFRNRPSSSNSVPAPKEPIYYRPPSSTRRFLPEGLLPPKTKHLGTSNRFPIIVNMQSRVPQGAASLRAHEELDTGENGAANPTGEWFSPVFQEALKRQVNKEKEFRRFGYNVLYLMASKLLVGVYDYFSILFHLKQLPFQGHLYVPQIKQNEEVENSGYSIYSALAIQALEYYLMFNIVLAIYRLFKPQDKCRDLPLTEKQRKLLGLPDEPYHEDKDADLTIRRRHYESENAGLETPLEVPKYTKLMQYSSYNYGNGAVVRSDELAARISDNGVDRAQLTYRTPTDAKLMHSGPLPTQRNAEEDSRVQEKFRQKFGLVFDCDEAEALRD